MSSAPPPPPPPPAFQPITSPPPQPPSPRRAQLEWFLAGGVVVGAIAAVAFFVLNVCPGCFGLATATPTPTATQVAITTPSPTLTPPTAPPTSVATTSAPATATPSASGPTPAATIPADIAAQIDQVVTQMPAIRELEPLRDVPYHLISRDQFEIDLRELYEEQVDLDVLAAQGRALIRLGLLPPDADLLEMVLEMTGGGVGAYYRFDNQEFYIIERAEPFGPLDRVFVAHEYTHALQDQHFNISETTITDPAEGDAALAQLSIREGDASTAMIQWATQNLSFDELIEVVRSSMAGAGDQATLDAMPPILSRSLTFPYQEGAAFVGELQQSEGWAAVNDALQDPPPSTEQILHPEKYAAREDPVKLSLAGAVDNLGAGWSEVYVDTFGEANLQVFTAGGERPLPDLLGGAPEWPHADVAAGWAGDRLTMWEGADGAWGIGWLIAWDSPADAAEFEARFEELKPTVGGPVALSYVKQDLLQVLIASDQAMLEELGAAVGE